MDEQQAERWRLFISSAVRKDNEWKDPKEVGAEPVTRTGGLDRIKARWAEAERGIIARRTVSLMTFSVQLATPSEHRIIKPLAWGRK